MSILRSWFRNNSSTSWQSVEPQNRVPKGRIQDGGVECVICDTGIKVTITDEMLIQPERVKGKSFYIPHKLYIFRHSITIYNYVHHSVVDLYPETVVVFGWDLVERLNDSGVEERWHRNTYFTDRAVWVILSTWSYLFTIWSGMLVPPKSIN